MPARVGEQVGRRALPVGYRDDNAIFQLHSSVASIFPAFLLLWWRATSVESQEVSSPWEAEAEEGPSRDDQTRQGPQPLSQNQAPNHGAFGGLSPQ